MAIIRTKDELAKFLRIEFERNKFSTSIIRRLLMRITYNDNYLLMRLLQALRYTEYYSDKKGFLSKILYCYYYYQLRKLRVKTNIMLFPGTIAEGIQLVHPGFRRIDTFVKIGRNCTILPMVLFGRKHPTDINSSITIGENCYISTGVTILGPVKIGNNVTIGAGAVVNKDLPDNAIAVGVPARVIKIRNNIQLSNNPI